MKSTKSILAIAAATTGLALVANAVERHTAVNESERALDTIWAGRGWDGEEISPEEQSVRMAANEEILDMQESQRNTRGLAGTILLGAALATFRSTRRRR